MSFLKNLFFFGSNATKDVLNVVQTGIKEIREEVPKIEQQIEEATKLIPKELKEGEKITQEFTEKMTSITDKINEFKDLKKNALSTIEALEETIDIIKTEDITIKEYGYLSDII